MALATGQCRHVADRLDGIRAPELQPAIDDVTAIVEQTCHARPDLAAGARMYG